MKKIKALELLILICSGFLIFSGCTGEPPVSDVASGSRRSSDVAKVPTRPKGQDGPMQPATQWTLVKLDVNEIQRRLSPLGFGGNPGAVWTNPSGTKIIVQDYSNGPGDFYIISQGSKDAKRVPRAGHEWIFFNDDGNVIAWIDYPTVTHRSDGSVLPIIGSHRVRLMIDGSGRFFYAYNWETGHGYVARFASPNQILFEFNEYPYFIWVQGDDLFLGCTSDSDNPNESKWFRYQERNGGWERTASLDVPGEIRQVEPGLEMVLVREIVDSLRLFYLFELDGRKLSVVMGGIPVFLPTDWFHAGID